MGRGYSLILGSVLFRPGAEYRDGIRRENDRPELRLGYVHAGRAHPALDVHHGLPAPVMLERQGREIEQTRTPVACSECRRIGWINLGVAMRSHRKYPSIMGEMKIGVFSVS